MLHLPPTKNKMKNEIFRLICSKDVFVEFSWSIRIEISCFSCVLVHKKFRNHLYENQTEFRESLQAQHEPAQRAFDPTYALLLSLPHNLLTTCNIVKASSLIIFK